ncbi:MAG TPA: carboxypeptidase-like regulatory domain-containing protein, partial [Bacteroidia bacterium]|nr:carboxypeptidase-like regulatory domain-containing protein [Bacteroidia bacterium]
MVRSITKAQRLLFFLICCHIQLIANAQNVNQIKGQVNDENGQPVASASVFAKNQTTGQSAATQTDSLGIFTYHNLPTGGPYSFVISHVGYQTQT